MTPQRQWVGLVKIFTATIFLLLASPLGWIGVSSLAFLIPSGWPAPKPGIGMVLVPFWLVGAFVAPITLLAAAVTKRRIELAAAAIGVCLLMWTTFEPSRQLVRLATYRGLSTIAGSAAPITDALDRHHTDRGAYPQNLDELVPKYLAEVPSTGLSAFPQFEYFRSETHHPPKGYELSVPFARTILDFSSYQYWPEQDYPRDWPLASPEIVGKWAIWHD